MLPMSYNLRASRHLWSVDELPPQLRACDPSSRAFAHAVLGFQKTHSLVADGKLGPNTIAAVRARSEPASGSPATFPTPTGDVSDSRILINGEYYDVPFSVTQHEPFSGRKRTKKVNTVLVHQSVTSSVATTERVLRKKGLGVHLMIDGDGSIHQYGDLATQKLAHGNERNGCSIGVEVINPYTKGKKPWAKPVPSKTAWKGKEVLDTDEQMVSLDALCAFLCSHSFPGSASVDIELSFPTTKKSGPSRGHAAWFNNTVGGIIAHGHRPSRYPAGHKKAGTKVRGAHADARMTVYRLLQRMA